MLDKGNYKGKVIEWGFGESSKKGTPYFEIVTRLDRCETRPGSGEFVGLDRPVTRSVQFYLTGKALEMSAANIRSLGFNDPDLRKLHPSHPEAHNLLDREVEVNVDHEEYEGRWKERIQLVRRAKALGLEALAALNSAADAFAKHQADAEAKAAGKPAPAKWVPPASEDDGPEDDEDDNEYELGGEAEKEPAPVAPAPKRGRAKSGSK